MSGLMVINRITGARNVKHKTHKRGKMTAKQLKYFGKRGGHKRVKRNPVAARSSSTRHRYFRRQVSSYKGRARSYAGKAGNFISKLGVGTLVPATVGAAGALALDMGWALLPIPASLQTGPLAPVVRLAGAIGIGMLAGAVLGKKFGREAMAGAVVVTVYDTAKYYLKTAYPSLPGLQGLGRYNAGMVIGRPMTTGMYVGHRGHHGRRRHNPDMGMYVGEYTPDYDNELTNDSEQFADLQH